MDLTKCSPYSKLYKGNKRLGCIIDEDINLLKNIVSLNKLKSIKNKCDGVDECVLKQIKMEYPDKDKVNIIKSIEKKSFKPQIPIEWVECKINYAPYGKCEYTWLSNNDISNIMKSYEYAYSNFDFLGVFLSNFFDTNKNLDNETVDFRNFDFSKEKYKVNKTNVCGCVFNTTTTGEHWIAVIFFWTKDKGEINYFNSSGIISPIPSYILLLMYNLCKKGKENNIDFICQCSKILHQQKDSECGVYCLYFLIYCLNNSFSSLNKRITDDEIHEYRFEYWKM